MGFGVKLGGKMEAKWSQKDVENNLFSKASKRQPKGGADALGEFGTGPTLAVLGGSLKVSNT